MRSLRAVSAAPSLPSTAAWTSIKTRRRASFSAWRDETRWSGADVRSAPSIAPARPGHHGPGVGENGADRSVFAQKAVGGAVELLADHQRKAGGGRYGLLAERRLHLGNDAREEGDADSLEDAGRIGFHDIFPSARSADWFCELMRLYATIARKSSDVLPSWNARAAFSQMPWHFTSVKTSHQCKRSGVGLEAARLLPDRDRRFALDDAARAAVARPLPGLVERPGEVLERVAEMRHLPVEDAVDLAVVAIEEVTDAVVAVDDGNALRRERRVRAEPADRGPDDGLRAQLFFVDDGFPAGQLVLPGRFFGRDMADAVRCRCHASRTWRWRRGCRTSRARAGVGRRGMAVRGEPGCSSRSRGCAP